MISISHLTFLTISGLTMDNPIVFVWKTIMEFYNPTVGLVVFVISLIASNALILKHEPSYFDEFFTCFFNIAIFLVTIAFSLLVAISLPVLLIILLFLLCCIPCVYVIKWSSQYLVKRLSKDTVNE